MAEAVKPWEAYQKKVEGPWTQYQSEPGPAKTDTERLVENAPDSFIRAGENMISEKLRCRVLKCHPSVAC